MTPLKIYQQIIETPLETRQLLFLTLTPEALKEKGRVSEWVVSEMNAQVTDFCFSWQELNQISEQDIIWHLNLNRLCLQRRCHLILIHIPLHLQAQLETLKLESVFLCFDDPDKVLHAFSEGL